MANTDMADTLRRISGEYNAASLIADLKRQREMVGDVLATMRRMNELTDSVRKTVELQHTLFGDPRRWLTPLCPPLGPFPWSVAPSSPRKAATDG